jgi:methanogenic corrinoid protein MtbC1
LLTSSYGSIELTMEEIKKGRSRDKVNVIIGGAPVITRN